MKNISMRKHFAIEWVNHSSQQLEINAGRDQDVSVKLNDLAIKNPICCWLILLEIFELTNQSELLRKVAKGPLEILLLLHSAQIKLLMTHEKINNIALQKTLTFVNSKRLFDN